MASFKVLAFLAVAFLAVSVAQASLFAVDDLPEAVNQQRSLLAIGGAPGTYSVKNERISARIALLIRAPKRKTVSFNLGGSFLVARIRAVQRRYNRTYKAKNNFSVKYASGPKKIKGQAWVYFNVAADIGPPGATYKTALKKSLRAAIKRPGTYVRVVRGNLPK